MGKARLTCHPVRVRGQPDAFLARDAAQAVRDHGRPDGRTPPRPGGLPAGRPGLSPPPAVLHNFPARHRNFPRNHPYG
ncbi:hypothetical protein GCM10018980_65120 [Streptomyces capoamus]|uniref:Uncharacterized protein n=1 Tax=Streptomyces capoamus TaxID=68183 RepID=A0A919F1X9_9ACTN|nr:hypothetical protein GCM10010501_63710 [Streptomyces libani subsp. rufus]GHG70442.1 hypothetical protein GCM10018980_65120 [Streptomyces capoamus]